MVSMGHRDLPLTACLAEVGAVEGPAITASLMTEDFHIVQ